MRYKIFSLMFLLLALSISCSNQGSYDYHLIKNFFYELKNKRYNKAIQYTDGEAKELITKITQDVSADARDLVFSKLDLVSVEEDDTWYQITNKNRDARVYRVRYSCVIDIQTEDQELKKFIEEAKNGDAIFYVKNRKIIRIIDIKGSVFRY